MPRVAQSSVSRIVDFFRSGSLDVMNLAFELVRDVVRERNTKSSKAKAKATGRKAAPPAPAPQVAPRKVTRKKRAPRRVNRKRQATTAPVEEYDTDVVQHPESARDLVGVE